MKKTLRTLMMGMMALLGCTVLTSCTNDDEPQVAQQEGQKGYVEFTLSRGADTRTTYAANTDGGLDVKWSKDDKMVVFYNEIVEVFDLVSGAGTTTGKFAKSDSQLNEKSGNVFIEYLPGIDETNYQTKAFDFSEQSGSLENFADYDAFAFEASLSNGQISAPQYKAAMAVYHFKAKDINFGVGDGNIDFVFSEGTNAIAYNGRTKGDITIKGVSLTGGKLDNDLYVAVYASHAPTTLTVGNQTFELPTGLDCGKVYTFAQEHLKAATPLTIEAIEAGTITIKNPQGLVISYQKNGGKKVTSTKDDTSDIGIPVVAGDKVQLFGDNPTYSSVRIQGDGLSKVYGNIMSLISSSDYSNMTELKGSFAFSGLFKDNTKLTDASGLILPATTLAEGCYLNMFYGGTALTQAPALPATTLTEYCYASMFYGCTSLTTAPELPATTLADYCYFNMFCGCTALTQAPALPATTLADCCYTFMFYGCTSLTEAPALPATTLTVSCYGYMFSDCTALTEAPTLPASTLANHCYSNMFKGCISLTEAPTLPATTLADGCYSYMFNGCTSLNAVTCLATDISFKEDATTDWLSGVAATGDFTKAAGSSWSTGPSGIPTDWEEHDYEG